MSCYQILVQRFIAAVSFAIFFLAANAQADLIITGSPVFDFASGNGFKGGGVPIIYADSVNNSGLAAINSDLYQANVSLGRRPIRIDGMSNTAVMLESLGASGTGTNSTWGHAINSAGTIVGFSDKYVAGSSQGRRAVRWDAEGTVATELGNLGTTSAGFSFVEADAINDSGTIVGVATKYVSGVNRGRRAVRWDAGGTIATELGQISTLPANAAPGAGEAAAINAGGTIVGSLIKYEGNNDKGVRPVRWDAGGTTATELGNLGLNASGNASGNANVINNAGTIVGYSTKYVGGADLGSRAVRWDAGQTTPNELGILGTSSTGQSDTRGMDINENGVIIGYGRQYAAGVFVGIRAIRWEANQTTPTELGNLATNSQGVVTTQAYALNDAGASVGQSQIFVNTFVVDHFEEVAYNRAVIWRANSIAPIDLNTLNVVSSPAGGTWTLTAATGISADGWMSGEGTFDPDGDGPLAAYVRMWVGQAGLGGDWLNISGTNNVWGKGQNWSSGTPAIQLDAVFNQNAAYTVAFETNATARTVSITAGTVNLALGSNTLAVVDGISIANGATLNGAGTLLADVTNAGTISPGNSPGLLVINGDLLNTGSLKFELASLANFDQINLDGVFTAGGTIQVDLLSGYSPVAGDTFDLMDFSSASNSGYAFDFSNAGLGPGLAWDTSSFLTTGSITVVPEPSSLMLLAGGSLALLLISRKKCV